MPMRTLAARLALTFGLLCVAAAAAAGDASDAAVMRRLAQVRDAFARRADEEGYRLCPAPAIELADPPSFGRFDPDSNRVQVATWSRLAPEQRQRFENLAAHTRRRLQPRGERCSRRHHHYGLGLRPRPGALVAELPAGSRLAHLRRRDRCSPQLALAFWRERDPAVRGTDARDLPRYLQERSRRRCPPACRSRSISMTTSSPSRKAAATAGTKPT